MSWNRFWRACRTALPALAGFIVLGTLAGCDMGSSSEYDNGPPPSTVLPSLFGMPTQSGSGNTTEQYTMSDVKRNDVNYRFMANGWGPGFQSQAISWNGTSFTVDNLKGTQGPNYEPIGYPTMFCGVYSSSLSGACGLPKPIANIQSLRTGWRWSANGNDAAYNAAYDIWLSKTADIGGHSSFLMIWLRDPSGAQPSGSAKFRQVEVHNAPGTWNIWVGEQFSLPCISYVRQEGIDSPALEVDVMDFIRDATARQINLPGSTVLSVAVGFEIWSPLTNLRSEDFYVQVQ
ncbi:MAG TPA: hypothetical protein VFK05_10360 [Polyangiaceae bacterium]|nr:hypothetical protein [Polyangiaceae bacterium]